MTKMDDNEILKYRQEIDDTLAEWSTLLGHTDQEQLREYRRKVGEASLKAEWLKKHCKQTIRYWQSKLDDCVHLKKRVEQVDEDARSEFFSLRDDAKRSGNL